MRLKVLVVDDDQMTLELLGMMLAAENVDVLGLRDAREASALIEKERFDGIFLDLTMPGLNGLQLAGRIRGSLHNATTPIVVITGRGDSAAAMKEAFSVGAHFFLAKPLDRDKLRRLLKSTHGSLLRERQRHRRVPLNVQISCSVGPRTLAGTALQISEQGLVFDLKDAVQPGDVVRVAFHLPPSSGAVEAMGVITPAGGERSTTCQFRKMDDASREAVRKFVASAPQ